MAMPVDAGALSAVRIMMRIILPLALQLTRREVRVATLSTVFRMVSMSCRSTFATDDASAPLADLVRARTAAGSDAIERLNVGSSGEGECRG
eukprot:6184028-Pleurochrysis_carterae.AAC.1